MPSSSVVSGGPEHGASSSSTSLRRCIGHVINNQYHRGFYVQVDVWTVGLPGVKEHLQVGDGGGVWVWQVDELLTFLQQAWPILDFLWLRLRLQRHTGKQTWRTSCSADWWCGDQYQLKTHLLLLNPGEQAVEGEAGPVSSVITPPEENRKLHVRVSPFTIKEILNQLMSI